MSYHYKILGLRESCNFAEIKAAYRKLALQFHPDKNPSPDAEKKFKEIKAAFDYLSNCHRHAHHTKSDYINYDNQSYKRTKPNYQNTKSDDEFSTCKECRFLLSSCTCDAAVFKMKDWPQDPPVEKDVFLTLEEIYKECSKQFKITRSIQQKHRILNVENIWTVNVKPGWKAGTKITFHREGNRKLNIIPADVVFRICEKLHDRFKRYGNDILYTHTISNIIAIGKHPIEIPLIDGTVHRVPFDKEFLDPKTTRRLTGFGLPSLKSKTRGDMVVNFIIEYPK